MRGRCSPAAASTGAASLVSAQLLKVTAYAWDQRVTTVP